MKKGRISPAALRRVFSDEAAAEAWLEAIRWGGAGAPDVCPICGAGDKLRAVPSRKPLPYWCGSCRRHFSVRTGSVMQRSRIPLRKWALATHLWAESSKGMSSVELHRALGITQKSAWAMVRRLNGAWRERSGEQIP